MDLNNLNEIPSQQPQNNNTNLNKAEGKRENAIRNYKIIYSAFFKYGLIILVIAIAVLVFLFAIKKEKFLNISTDNDAQINSLTQKHNDNLNKIKNIEQNNKELNIKIKQGTLNINESVLISYNNLLSFKGFTLPRGVFLNEDSIENREYFDDNNYDVEQLSRFINNIIFVNYDEIILENEEEPQFIGLDSNNIEKTFFLSCANRPKLVNRICNKYIDKFLNGFYVYNIKNDFSGFTKTVKNLIIKRSYKQKVCDGLNNYINYSRTAPTELEDIAVLCGGEYSDNFYMIQDFIKVKSELENQYITPNTSKYKSINEYKLTSYQQIIYNNIEKGIPPSEGLYKNYTSYLSTLLKKYNGNPIDPILFDATYWINNVYVIPALNKLKYQSTQTKREEIQTIINDLEKINNGDKIDGYIGLKFALTNKSLEEDVAKIKVNFVSERDDIMSVLLKSLKSLNYLKIINDEIFGDFIRIIGYIPDVKVNTLPIQFTSTLRNKNGKLVVESFSLGVQELNYIFDKNNINEVLKVMLQQKEYSIGEIYEFVEKNMKLYDTNDYDGSPCEILKNKLETMNIEGLELLICNEKHINILKGQSGAKILYQFKMDDYNINSISTTNTDIQEYINSNYSGTTSNSITIGNIITNIIGYEPEEQEISSSSLEGNNNVIIAIEDLKKYLGVDVADIGERNGKVAAEFAVSNIDFIGIYDTETKKLGPIFLKEPGEEKGDIIINNFSLYLTEENQNEINIFIIETLDYIYALDPALVSKYLADLLADYLSSKLGLPK